MKVDKILQFFKTKREGLLPKAILAILILGFLILFSEILRPVLGWMANFESNTLRTARYLFTVLLAVVVFFLSKRVRQYVTDHEQITQVFLVLITLILTLGSYMVSRYNAIDNLNDALTNMGLEDYNEAYSRARDIETSSEYIYWNDLLYIEPFKQNFDFVIDWHGINCAVKFSEMMKYIDSVNRINYLINDHIGWPTITENPKDIFLNDFVVSDRRLEYYRILGYATSSLKNFLVDCMKVPEEQIKKAER